MAFARWRTIPIAMLKLLCCRSGWPRYVTFSETANIDWPTRVQIRTAQCWLSTSFTASAPGMQRTIRNTSRVSARMRSSVGRMCAGCEAMPTPIVVIRRGQGLWGGKTSGALRLPVRKRGASPFRRRLNQAAGCRATADARALPSAGSSPTEPPLPFRSPSVLRFDRQDAIGNVRPTRRVEDGTAAPAPRSTGLAPRLPCLYAGCRRDMLVRGCPDHQRHSSQTARCVPLRTRG